MVCVKLVGTGYEQGGHQLRSLFKTDGAEKAHRVGVPRLRTCFFKTDGVCEACWDKLGAWAPSI